MFIYNSTDSCLPLKFHMFLVLRKITVTWASDRGHHQLTISQWWSVTHMWSEYLGNDSIAWRENRYLEKSYQNLGSRAGCAGGGNISNDSRHWVSCSIIRAECHQGVWSQWTRGNGLLLPLMFTPGHNEQSFSQDVLWILWWLEVNTLFIFCFSFRPL